MGGTYSDSDLNKNVIVMKASLVAGKQPVESFNFSIWIRLICLQRNMTNPGRLGRLLQFSGVFLDPAGVNRP